MIETKSVLKTAVVLIITETLLSALVLAPGIGTLSGGIGMLISSYLTLLWLPGNIIGDRPLLILGILFIIPGIQFITIGLIGELIISMRDNGNRIIRPEQARSGSS